jgi:ATP citrate (pro-S)-lyase
LTEYQKPLLSHNVKIFVRRAGPNYQEGLKLIRTLGETLGFDMQVFGPEMFVTGIVPLALKGAYKGMNATSTANKTRSTSLLDINTEKVVSQDLAITSQDLLSIDYPVDALYDATPLVPFTSDTRSFVYGMQPKAVQGESPFK